jgi:hypothetical protein
VKISQIVLCAFTRKDNGEVVLSACRNSSFTQTKTGEFEVSYSFPTEYHLTIEAEGYEAAEAFTPKVTKLEDITGIHVKMTKRKTETVQPASFQQRLTGTVNVGGEMLKSARVGLCMPPRQYNAVNSHTVRGRTTLGDGKVLASAILSDGRFSLDVPFQDENWHVIVETPARVVALHGPIRIAQGKTNHIELTAQSPGGVRGRVANNSAIDLPLWAVLFSKSGIQYETRVKKNGSFEFMNVLPGEYGLKVACESIRDSEIPPLPDIQNVTLEASFELALIPSLPWQRATRITVEPNKITDGLLVSFQP